jgi:hypothetical protein
MQAGRALHGPSCVACMQAGPSMVHHVWHACRQGPPWSIRCGMHAGRALHGPSGVACMQAGPSLVHQVWHACRVGRKPIDYSRVETYMNQHACVFNPQHPAAYPAVIQRRWSARSPGPHQAPPPLHHPPTHPPAGPQPHCLHQHTMGLDQLSLERLHDSKDQLTLELLHYASL